ncbi:MAG: ABC transporter permease subunit [Dehalococcoidia bacterium]|nr:ABC transporter permease subunit [Dehalococcoidia bacterium]
MPSPVLVLAALAVAAVSLLPPVYLVVRISDAPARAIEVIARSSTLELTWRTLLFASAATALAMAIALPMAWLTERSDLPGRRVLRILGAMPLAIPSYVGAMVAVSALGPRGLLQQALEPLGVDRLPSIYGFWGATFVLALFTYPYLLLTLRPALLSLDPRLEELSRGFGYGRWTTFGRVILPQLRPALFSGGLLVALYALSDFGAVSLLRFDTLTRVIYTSYRSSFDRTSAASFALVLAVIALAIVTLEVWSRGRRRYDAIRGAGRQAPVVPLGRWRWPALAFVAVVIAFALVMPAGVLAYWLVRGMQAGEVVRAAWSAAGNSVLASALAAVAAAVAALPVAILAVRHRDFPLSRPIEVLSYTGYALPGIVVALALVFAGINFGPLYQSLTMLVLAYVLLFLPQAMGATRVALLQARPSMEEAARGLGRRPWQVLATITVPLASRGMLAGAALVFLTTMKELPATVILHPTGFETLAMRVFDASREAFFARAAFPALLLIVLSSLPLALMQLPPGTRLPLSWLARLLPGQGTPPRAAERAEEATDAV